ncbi:hypothetical protein MKY04_12725 [Lysinibacillus telephonicus]|uniref:hypothetical protein n=1 Tax=Lysinibacillus telephonicus TaxID=1714840 RepID=UPI0031FE1C3D
MKVKSVPSFTSLDDIADRFEKVTSKIQFENREYKYLKTVFEDEINKLIYRCEEERHNLIISMMGDVVVVDVEGVYSVGDVAI